MCRFVLSLGLVLVLTGSTLDAQTKAQRAFHQEIANLIRTGQLDEAESKLEAAIEAESGRDDLHRLREQLAKGYLARRNHDAAYRHAKLLYQYREPTVETRNEALGLVSATHLLWHCGKNAGKADDINKHIDRTLEICEVLEKQDPSTMLSSITMLWSRKAMMLSDAGKTEQAMAMANKQLQRVVDFNASAQANDQTAQAEGQMLVTMWTKLKSNETQALADRLDRFIDEAYKEYPDAVGVRSDFINYKYMLIRDLYPRDPDAARKRIEQLRAELANFPAHQIKYGQKLLQSIESRMQRE